MTTMHTKHFGERGSTELDQLIYKRDGEWYYCYSDDYTTGPFAEGDDEGPYESLYECCRALMQIADRIDPRPR